MIKYNAVTGVAGGGVIVFVSKFLLGVAAAAMAVSAASALPYLYVENAGSGDVSVISVPDHKLVSRIPVGANLDDVVGTADGKTILVGRAVEKNHSWGIPEAGEIIAIDTGTEKVKWRLPIEKGWPHHLAVSKAGRLYVPLFDRAFLEVVDVNSGKIVGRIDGDFGMHTIRLSPDDKRLYAGSILTQQLYVLDVEKNKLEKIISFQDGVRPFTFTKDEKTLYAQLSRLHGFAVVDLEKGVVTKTVNLPDLGPDFKVPERFPHNVNHGLELSPDEKYLLAAGSAGHYVAVYTHPDLKLVKVIPTAKDPNWITFSPDGKFAYIGCRGSNEVSIISMADLSERRVKTEGEGSARLKVVDVPNRQVPKKL